MYKTIYQYHYGIVITIITLCKLSNIHMYFYIWLYAN